MKQLGLTDARLMKRSKKTRKEQFLEEMNAIVPWQHLLAAIEPHYPQAARGRRRVALETMLRVHLLQHLFNYSDPAMEEALHGEEEAAHGDKAYFSNQHNLLASDPEKGPIWCMPFKKPPGGELPEWKQEINRRLASLRAIVEFPFRIIKRQFGFAKIRYRGLYKNGQALTTKFALANLYTVRRTLLSVTG